MCDRCEIEKRKSGSYLELRSAGICISSPNLQVFKEGDLRHIDIKKSEQQNVESFTRF